MFYTIVGVLNISAGVWGLLCTYKNRNKINMAAIFSKKDRDKYEVVNMKELLRLQNIKSLLIAVSFISIGVLGLWLNPKIYILICIIPGASNIISNIQGIEYVKLKL